MLTNEGVAARVRAWRLKRGMSQETLAGLIGKSDRWMVLLERGKVDVKVSDLGHLAHALRLGYPELLDGALPATPDISVRPQRKPVANLARAATLDTQWGTRLGKVWFPWVVAGYGPYRPEDIESYFHPGDPGYPAEVDQVLASLKADIAQRSTLGEDVPFDSPAFKLSRFHVSSRTAREEPRLVLHFEPTTYFHMLATDQRLDVADTWGGRTYTLRERYAAEVNLRAHPVQQFATHWGIGLAAITADGLLLIPERGNTAVDPHVIFPSVAESANRDFDSDASGAPDHFTVAARGTEEELGVTLEPDDLTWLSFGANSYLCEYGLIGRADLRATFSEIEQRRAVGAAKDSWETSRLHVVPFSPEAAAAFLAVPGRRVSAFGLVAFTHALMSEFGIAKVETAFADIAIAVSQHLPDWLTATRVA